MNRFLWIVVTVSMGLCHGSLTAQQVSLSIHPDRVLNRIEEEIYGHFLEHIYHSCNGGLWGDVIWDRSFEGGGAEIAWRRTEDMIAQQGNATNVRLVFGDPDWSDYEFTVDARKTGGQEGFLILFRVRTPREFYWANLGGWGNVGHALERGLENQDRWGAVTPRTDGRIERDRWYRIRVRCEGRRALVWLDDELVIDYFDDGRGPAAGRVGVGTWATQAQFRNFRVTSLDGAVLYEGLPPLPTMELGKAPQWITFGAVTSSDSQEKPLNGNHCRELTITGNEGGLQQGPLCVKAGERYAGSLWAEGPWKGRWSVRLLDGDQVLAEQFLGEVASQWTEHSFELEPTRSCDDALFQIRLQGEGNVRLDQVSVMPESWREAGGFRPDLLGAIADLRPPIIRWPGGCFASSYRWKQGVGPQHERRPHPRAIWEDRDVYSFGTDEFVALCRNVGAEPLIVVNIGTPNWNQEAQDVDFLQEVLDWIEYCNGPADSKWGRLRAEHGHPEPYGVKYWEIDNETWHMGAERYAEWVNRFAPAMRAKDPSIKLIACGSGGYGQAWNETVIRLAGKNFDYISTHHYENPDNFASGPPRDEAFYRELQTIIRRGPNPNMKIYCSEWNAQSTDWRTGLYCGGILNVFERCGDVFEMGGPALFLRHVSASHWDNAFINFDHCRWFPAPNYVVMKLWHNHYAPHRIELTGDGGSVNAVATMSEDGKTIYFKMVNPSERALTMTVTVAQRETTSATLEVVAPGSLSARNTLDQPDAVRPERAPVRDDGGKLSFSAPPLSCAVLTISVR